MNVLPFVVCYFLKRFANVLYLAEGRVGVKQKSRNDTPMKAYETLGIFYETIMNAYEDERYDREQEEAVAAILVKYVSTQRLLWCGFQQVAACLPLRISFARTRDLISTLSVGTRRCQEVWNVEGKVPETRGIVSFLAT